MGNSDAPYLGKHTLYKNNDLPCKLPVPWTTTWCLQHFSAVHTVGSRLVWVRCLFDPLQLWGFWGQITPKQKLFENLFRYVSKLPKSFSYSQQKKAAHDSSEPSPPHCTPAGLIVSKISWTLSPLDLCVCTEFGQNQLWFAEVVPERLIF